MNRVSVRGIAETDKAMRYVKQLVSHATHAGLHVSAREDGWLLALDSSTISLRAGTQAVHIVVQGHDADAVREGCDVAASHLEHFGSRAQLSVVWQEPSTATD
jgi:hypothetical protein